MPGSPDNEQHVYGLPPHKDKFRLEHLTDYSWVFTYIRADRSTTAFLSDLHDTKKPLLSYCNEIFADSNNSIYQEKYFMRSLPRKFDVVRHLDKTLRLHVYNIDPFPRATDLFLKKKNVELEIDSMQGIAEEWLETHPDSEPAQVIAESGAGVPLIYHHRFLQEKWPIFVPILTSHYKKES